MVDQQADSEADLFDDFRERVATMDDSVPPERQKLMRLLLRKLDFSEVLMKRIEANDVDAIIFWLENYSGPEWKPKE